MRRLYLDLSCGAAGDMLAAALYELIGDKDGFIAEMNALGIPGVRVSAERLSRCGVVGTHFTVLVHGEDEAHGHHHHHGTHDIEHLIHHLPVSDKVKADVNAVYGLIAEAESAVHGLPVSEIHFHEVGAMDAVADVTAVCLLMERLAPESVAASPVCVGGGTVKCAHGVLPVPAPATALLLKGVPIYEGEIKKELCTPTGAALLKYFVRDFCPMPLMTLAGVGCGMGSRDFGNLNALRAFLGEGGERPEDVREMCANLDDMTPEAIGFAMERLFDAGALDVWTTPIGMKKCRPATMLSVLCRQSDAERLRTLFFRHTTTLGIREYAPARHVLPRTERTIDTPNGPVRIKSVTLPDGTQREKAEYEDVARIARETGVSLREVNI